MTIVYSAESATQQKTRSTLLPLLIVLFIASYAILAMLVVEQGRTIEAQRGLLREMLKDSTQLAELKGKLAHADADHPSSKPVAEPQKKTKDKAPADSTAAAPKAPAGEAKHAGKSARTSRQLPEKPAEDLQDVRRSTSII